MQAVQALVPIASGTAPAIGPAPIAIAEGPGFAAILAEGEGPQPGPPADPDGDAIAEAPTIGVPIYWSPSPVPDTAAPISVGCDRLLDATVGPPAKVLDAAPTAEFEPAKSVEPMVPAVPAAPETTASIAPLPRIAGVSAQDRPGNPDGQPAALDRVEPAETEPPDRPAPPHPSVQERASAPTTRSAVADLEPNPDKAPDKVLASGRTQLVPDAPGNAVVNPPMRANAPLSVAAPVPSPGMPSDVAAKARPALRAAPLPDREPAVLPDMPVGTAVPPMMRADAPPSGVAALAPPPFAEPSLGPDLGQTKGAELPLPVPVPAALTTPAPIPSPANMAHPPPSIPMTEARPVGNAPLQEVRDPAPLADPPAARPGGDALPPPAVSGVLAAVPTWLRAIPAWLEIARLEQHEADGIAALGPAPVSAVAAPVGAPALPPTPPPIATQVLHGLALHQDGTTEITLSPEELGTVRLRLRPDSRDHERMVVMLSFDRPETLDLFRRNADQLAEAIRSAGYAGVDIGFDRGGDARPDFSDGQNPGDSAPHNPDLPQPTPRILTGATLDLRL